MAMARKSPNTWGQKLLIALAWLGMVVLAIIPMVNIFIEAFAEGAGAFVDNITHDMTTHALWLSLKTAMIVVPITVVFGVMFAWLTVRFDFVGKSVLPVILDLPFAVSPVMVGMAFMVLYNPETGTGLWLQEQGIKVLFSPIAIVMVSLFVSTPFVARTLIPLMQQQSIDTEEAALTLGASKWRMFLTVTLPSLKWGILLGAVLSLARTLGEFGAVAVVSGSIRGETNTLPLHVDVLFNDYNQAGAFAVASVLVVLALFNLLLRLVAERKIG